MKGSDMTDIANQGFKTTLLEILGKTPRASLTYFLTAQITGTSYKSRLKEFDLNGILVNLEARYGGEDMGSDYWSVFKFTKDSEDIYVQFVGFYGSYDGAEYGHFVIVTPREVTETKYFAA
jgi:hypothetical protein